MKSNHNQTAGLTSPARLADHIYAGPGFEPFGAEIVVKFGGNLLSDVSLSSDIADEIVRVSKQTRLVVFPGGGPTDNVIEELAGKAGIASHLINAACMRALDQTGILLSRMHPQLTPVESLAAARSVLVEGQVPVLLPSSMILSLDVFTRTDTITSDTLGAYFAFLMAARLYVVLTNVDGIFVHHSNGSGKGLLDKVSATELAKIGVTSVDRCLAPFVSAVQLPVWIINGRHPGRLGQLLEAERPVGTEIVP